MRVASSVTSITWVPFGALDALPEIPLSLAIGHYDEAPPEVLDDLGALRRAGAFREANELRAWIEVDGGRVVACGHDGAGVVGEPEVDVASGQVAFAGVELPVIRPAPEVSEREARFTQTVGGRIGLPLPRPVPGRPYPQLAPAAVWTTLQLTVRADGTSEGALVGCSPFPSHWVYDAGGRILAKREAINLAAWYEDAFGAETPWGDDAAVTTALEAELARAVLRDGTRMERRSLHTGETLVEQGDSGDVLYLLLIGALDVEVDGAAIAQVGPGAIVGERAVLEGGRRTATLRAAMPSRVASVPAARFERSQLRRLSLGRRREHG